jgi:hypothetical protein
MVEQHEADKKPNDNLEPAKPQEQPEDKDDREKYGRFDPSSGAQAQKTPKHPIGDRIMKPTRTRDSLQNPEVAVALRGIEDRLAAVERRLAGGIGPRNGLGQSIFPAVAHERRYYPRFRHFET